MNKIEYVEIIRNFLTEIKKFDSIIDFINHDNKKANQTLNDMLHVTNEFLIKKVSKIIKLRVNMKLRQVEEKLGGTIPLDSSKIMLLINGLL